MIPPGQWLGVVGGGQLGRMFCAAAQALGYRVCVLDPDADSPAGAVADRHLCAAHLDQAALDQLARLCRAVTTEFENVPAAALERLARSCPVRPSPASVAVAQDRAAEKGFLAAAGAEVAPHALLQRPEDVQAIDPALFPGILKTARLGYDGKGQRRVARAGDLAAAWEGLGRVPAVLEQQLALARELSVIVVRGADGAVACLPVAENVHREGILAVTVAPARVAPRLAARAQEIAVGVAQALDYVGVLCVELFELADGRLLANEIAPRPHNSGHFSIEACTTSQFAQQARVLADLPLGDTTQLAPAVMLNLLGGLWFQDGRPREPDFPAVLRIPGTCLHLYGKREARPGRKMGHLTVLGASLPEAIGRAASAAAILGLEPPR